jgi:hypothetical protein
MKPIDCTETSAMNYHYSLRNKPEQRSSQYVQVISHLNAESNPICHLLALLGAHLIFHVRGLRVNIENVESSTSTSGVSESYDCGG